MPHRSATQETPRSLKSVFRRATAAKAQPSAVVSTGSPPSDPGHRCSENSRRDALCSHGHWHANSRRPNNPSLCQRRVLEELDSTTTVYSGSRCAANPCQQPKVDPIESQRSGPGDAVSHEAGELLGATAQVRLRARTDAFLGKPSRSSTHPLRSSGVHRSRS